MGTEQIAYAAGWALAVVTPRGTAALRLSEFRDVWDRLTLADRAYFARELSELLVDACEGDILTTCPPSRSDW